MRQTAMIMGTAVSLDIPGCAEAEVFEAAFERLRQIDEKFSTYKSGSEVSRFAAGEIPEAELSSELKAVIKACRLAEKSTDGYFSAWAAGAFDPSGYVKGWAIAAAAKAVDKQGYKTYCLSIGGDILARSDGDKVWNIGIQDPADKKDILNMLSISSGAVATSGNYERGKHIINPKTKKPIDKLLSVTISGPDIITADVLATAVFASGRENPGFLLSYKHYQALVISRRSPGNNR